jgi:hypothetical protein
MLFGIRDFRFYVDFPVYATVQFDAQVFEFPYYLDLHSPHEKWGGEAGGDLRLEKIIALVLGMKKVKPVSTAHS